MNCQWDDTIVGLSSASGDGCRAIVRLTGPNSASIVSALQTAATHDGHSQTRPLVQQTEVLLSQLDRSIPAAIYTWPQGRSSTGQSLAEFHIPAGPALASALIFDVLKAGARLAQPGEFTLRAFLAGRLDLAQAEGVLGLVEADNLSRLRAAIDQRLGGLSRRVAEMRDQLLDLLADLEAGLDFVEEGIEFISDRDLRSRMQMIENELTTFLADIDRRSADFDLRRVALIGPANAGKSSLFNALVGDAKAIVSETPGTTRDYVSAIVILDDEIVELVDTAGFYEETGELQTRADHARDAVTQSADLVLFCQPVDVPESASAKSESLSQRTFLVRTKSDLKPEIAQSDLGLAVSSTTGEGIDTLRSFLHDQLSNQIKHDAKRGHFGLSDRCRQSLSRSLDSIQEATRFLAEQTGSEFVAVSLRESCDALGEIVGVVYTEDLLGRIFSRFCIGK